MEMTGCIGRYPKQVREHWYTRAFDLAFVHLRQLGHTPPPGLRGHIVQLPCPLHPSYQYWVIPHLHLQDQGSLECPAKVRGRS